MMNYTTSLSDAKSREFAEALHESMIERVKSGTPVTSRLLIVVPTMKGLDIHEVVLPKSIPNEADAEMLFEMVMAEDESPVLGIAYIMDGFYLIREGNENPVRPSEDPNRGNCYQIVFSPMDDRVYSSFIPYQENEGGGMSIILDDVIPVKKEWRLLKDDIGRRDAFAVDSKGVYNRFLNLFIDAAKKVVYDERRPV